MFIFVQYLLLFLSLFFLYLFKLSKGYVFEPVALILGIVCFAFFIYRLIKHDKSQNKTQELQNQLVSKTRSTDKTILNLEFDTPVITINSDNKTIMLINENNEVKFFAFNEISKYEISIDDFGVVQKDLSGTLFTPVFSNVGSFSVKMLRSAKITIYLNRFDTPFETCIIWDYYKVKKGSDAYIKIENEIKKATAYFDIISSVVSKD
ncbi:MAG: hypothetical protein RR554_11180 [Vagococcus sp.]|uniref:hypothetical protein n=1 Tax=Vagococcus sp. TaxID=1933889 RepID=UPI002FC58DEE